MKSQSDYEELIKAGKLDITTREAVENEADHEARKAEPGEYALTYSQHILLLRASNTLETVILQSDSAETDKTTGERVTLASDALLQKIRKEWQDRKITLAALRRIVAVLEGNWYTLQISTKYKPPIKRLGLSLLAHIDGTETGGILPYEQYTAVYQDTTRKEQRECLLLPDNTKFLYSAEYNNIIRISEVLSDPKKRRNYNMLERETGAIITIGGRLSFPSGKNLGNAFSADKIRKMPNAALLGMDAQETEKRELTFEEVMQYNGAVMGVLFGIAKRSDNLSTIRFSDYRLCEEMKIDPREYSKKRPGKEEYTETPAELRKNAIESLLRPFEDFWYTIDDEEYRILFIKGYNKTDETHEIQIPAIEKYFQNMTEKESRNFNNLIYAGVVTEKNGAAKEVVQYVTNGILMRGEKKQRPPTKTKETKTKKRKDGTIIKIEQEYEAEPQQEKAQYGRIEWAAYYQTIIDNCPQFKMELTKIEERTDSGKSQAYNSKLKQVFEAAFRMLFTQTDLPKNYKNFRINGFTNWTNGQAQDRKRAIIKVPTKKTLKKEKLTLSHDGIIKK